MIDSFDNAIGEALDDFGGKYPVVMAVNESLQGDKSPMAVGKKYVRMDIADQLAAALQEISDGIPDIDGDYYDGCAHEYKLIADKALASYNSAKDKQ